MDAENWLREVGIKISNPIISYAEDRPLGTATRVGEVFELFPFSMVQMWTEFVNGTVLISFESVDMDAPYQPCFMFCFLNQCRSDVSMLVDYCKQRGLLIV